MLSFLEILRKYVIAQDLKLSFQDRKLVINISLTDVLTLKIPNLH
jgi:hypothetical protein